MVRRAPREPIEVEVQFPENLGKPSLVKVVTDLMKNLLHQRNQIPLQYDAILKDVLACQEMKAEEDLKENVDPVEDNIASVPTKAPSRESVRLDRQAARAAKSRVAYMKYAARLVKEVEQLVEMVKQEVENDDLVSVSLLFGATPLSPREVYTICVPPTTDHLQPLSRLGVHIFRAMVTHDQLHTLTSTRLPVSNMFTIFCRKSSPQTSSLQLLPSYSLPPCTRCPRVTFNLNTPNQLEDSEGNLLDPVSTTRRLRFHSGHHPSHTDTGPEHHQAGLDRVTPHLEQDPLASPAKNQEEVDRAEYKDQEEVDRSEYKDQDVVDRSESVLRTSRKVQHMELCTPLVGRWSGPPRTGEIVTPHVTMDLCTPQVGRWCTPAVGARTGRTQAREDMDMCTPAVNLRTKFSEGIMELCTPAVSTRTRDSETMDLCTPAPAGTGLCTPAVTGLCTGARTREGDFMEFCTPALGKLVLNSDVDGAFDDVTDDMTDDKHEMKDSGISSPVTSKRDLQKVLFWFVTPVPVRGFKC
eukprot:GFUD01073083.1.p1 GENE.GFUD01073083.1~~GFUD01073083.1.p1  ORF type:complete len:525 (+),score=153.31 GFUD01073083.1:49-1623(+)